MKSRALRRAVAAVLALTVCTLGVARAETVPRLVDIPADVASFRPDLVRQRGSLVGERDTLRAQTQAHRAACASVVAGSAADAKCASDNARLSAAVGGHVAASKRFNDAVGAAGRQLAGCAAAGQLKVVDRRVANLQKAIDLLGDPRMFEEGRERVMEDLHEDAWGLSFELVNLVTLGLARGAKEFTRLNVLAQKADAAKFASQIGQIANEESKLEKVVTELKDMELVRRVYQYKAALYRVRIAEQGAKSAEMLSHTREAAEALHGNYEQMKINPPTRSAADALYGSSAMLGSIALIFVEGSGAVAAAGGSAAASIAIGGREAVNLWQELGRLGAVYRDAAARGQMRNELLARLGKVLQRQAELARLAKGAAGCPR